MAVALKPTHDALDKLIRELKSLPKEKLMELESKVKNKKTAPTLTTASSWLAALEMARDGLEEWCRGGGFIIDSEPEK